MHPHILNSQDTPPWTAVDAQRRDQMFHGGEAFKRAGAGSGELWAIIMSVARWTDADMKIVNVEVVASAGCLRGSEIAKG